MSNATATTQTTAIEITTVEGFFDQIVTISKRTTRGILEIAQLITRYESEQVLIKTTLSAFNDLESKLIKEQVMAPSTISSYRKIGNCSVLWEFADVLPPFFNHIYQLACAEAKNPGFIRKNLSKATISPSSTLSQIKALTAPSGIAANNPTFAADTTGKVLLKVYADESDVVNVINELEQRLSTRSGVVIDYTQYETLEAKRQSKMVATAHKKSRRIAYSVIKEFKRSTLAKLTLAPDVKSKKAATIRWITGNGEVEEFLRERTLSGVVKDESASDYLDPLLAQINHPQNLSAIFNDCLANYE